MYKSHDPNSNELFPIIKFLGRNKSAKIESLFKLNSKELKVQIFSSPVSHLHSLSRRVFETPTHKFTLHHFNPHIFFYVQHTASLFTLILTATINFKEICVLLNLSPLAFILETSISLDDIGK